jgi:hypothetical protein
MSSVASAASSNPGLTNLLQSLTQIGSPLASSPQVVAALQKSSPADIAQLSEEAIQLQGVDALFGSIDSNSTNSSSANPNSLFATLDQSLAAPGSAYGSLYNATSNDSNTLLANLEQTLASRRLAGSSVSGSSTASGPSTTASGSSTPGTTSQGGLQAAQVQALFGNSGSLFGAL